MSFKIDINNTKHTSRHTDLQVMQRYISLKNIDLIVKNIDFDETIL